MRPWFLLQTEGRMENLTAVLELAEKGRRAEEFLVRSHTDFDACYTASEGETMVYEKQYVALNNTFRSFTNVAISKAERLEMPQVRPLLPSPRPRHPEANRLFGQPALVARYFKAFG
ncbi:hypothetical protein AN958_08365 [Leucoagaricus sp. SymC.cos]|nr:hypothetical protein AN958_08365 [Leucoagaricus sp. SymC.cos]